MSDERIWLIIIVVIGCMSDFACLTTDDRCWQVAWKWVSIFCYISCFIISMVGKAAFE